MSNSTRRVAEQNLMNQEKQSLMTEEDRIAEIMGHTKKRRTPAETSDDEDG